VERGCSTTRLLLTADELHTVRQQAHRQQQPVAALTRPAPTLVRTIYKLTIVPHIAKLRMTTTEQATAAAGQPEALASRSHRRAEQSCREGDCSCIMMRLTIEVHGGATAPKEY
jgi:hypothetical protein